MLISLVVAATENNAIGKNNQLLWHLPNDMKFFKNITWGLPILMGRKTFESMGNKPLNGRINIILTRQKNWKSIGAVTVNSFTDAVFFAQENDYKQLMIIGGAEIYKEFIDKADRIYLTRVHATLEADAYFPEIDERKWQIASNESFVANEKHAYGYSFQVWEKK